jgi:diaminopimelate epimerase
MLCKFKKMQGIGNDFVLIDSFSEPLVLTTEQIKHIANRNFGIGCDQVLLLEPPKDDESDVYYRIFNSDGSEVSQCGNGARCSAIYLYDKGLVKKQKMIAETKSGKLVLKINKDNSVTVNMGIPKFEPKDIPINYEKKMKNYSLRLNSENIEFGAVSIGNPHAIIFVDDIELTSIEKIAIKIQQDKIFPEGVNVSFVQILDRKKIKLRVFERGVGETLSCGSGACASVVVASQRGGLEENVEAELRGGVLKLSWAGEGKPIFMNGPVSTVYDGEIEL